MLARSRRTRPCGIRCAAAAVMLAQSRRTRPCGIRCAAAVVMLAQSRRTRPCGCLCATAAVILELHPTAPTLLLLSTETTRTRFALWTGWGMRPHQLIITEGMRTSRVTWRVVPKSAVQRAKRVLEFTWSTCLGDEWRESYWIVCVHVSEYMAMRLLRISSHIYVQSTARIKK